MPTCSDTGNKYTFRQLEELWLKAGGNPSMATVMAAIGYAESSGGLKPYGDCGLGAPGPTSFGIWQIHTPAHPTYNAEELVKNPLYNAKAAVAVSGNSTAGLGAWTTYKTGAYKSYLGYKSLEKQKGFSESGKENVEGLTEPFGGPHSEGAAEGAFNAAISWTKELGEILKFLGSGAGWLRVGKVVVGSAMLLIAVAELSKIGAGSGGGITKTGKKAFELTAAGAAIAAAKKDKEEPEEQEEETVEESNSRVQEEVADERPYQEQYGSFVSGG
jgi:hypothetical protein